MQVQYSIDERLAHNLIHFLGNSWINDYKTYRHEATPAQAAKSIESHIEVFFENGFEASWSLGGTNNNCWGDSYSMSAEVEPDLPYLDEFFLEYYPHIGFMHYKIISKSITRSTDSNSDYYGGNTQDGKKNLSFSDLSSAMIKTKVISNPVLISTADISLLIKNYYSVEKMTDFIQPAPVVKSTKSGNKKKIK